MYQALYRKYRPKTFDDVVGQTVVIKTLQNSILLNKISHAYLFNGPRGSGKTSIAKILAKTVNCQNLVDCKICGDCVFCTQNSSENMDIIEIDAASNNGVDEIREINNKVNLSPSLGKYKVYIIDEVHMLTIGAFNALLKTLEEPPAHIIFILATTDPQKVPLTILSRCQRLDFKKISITDTETRLNYIIKNENINITSEAINKIAYLSDGSMRDALGMLDQALIYTDNNITLESINEIDGSVNQDELIILLQTIISSSLDQSLNIIDGYANEGKNLSKIIEDLIYLMRDILISKVATTEKDFPKEVLNVENNKILEYIKILNDTLVDIKKSHNPKVDFQLAIIKIILNINGSSKDFEKQEVTKKIVNDSVNETAKEEVNKNSKEGKTLVKQEKREIISQEINSSFNQNYEEFKKTRISNTLANFSKKELLEIKKQMEQIDDYLLDEAFGYLATKILDASIKAASENYIVFVFKTKASADDFNETIKEIENLIERVTTKTYKVIATDDNDWDVIKQQFNSKKIEFIYQPEKYQIDDIITKKENDSITNLFSDVIEFN